MRFALFCVFWISALFAEPYLGFHGGYTFAMSLTDVQLAGTNLPPGTTSAPIQYNGSGMYGGVAGHFIDRYPWLGLALYIDTFRMRQKRENLTVSTPAWGPISALTLIQDVGDGYLRIIESDFLLMLRYPSPYFELYAGTGIAVVAAKRKLEKATTNGVTVVYNVSSHAIAPGLNGRLGVRLWKKYHFSPYAEWSITWSQLTFFPKGGASSSGISGIQGQYLVQTVLGGISYVF